MKSSRLIPIIGACLAALTVAVIVEAQPVGPVGIPRVVSNSPGLVAGSGTTTNPLTVTISTSGIISGTGSSGSPITATETGDISSVAAGSGLSGGGTSGALTIDFGCGTGLSCGADSASVDTSVIQARVSSTCSAPNAIRAVAADGTVTCTSGTGSVTNIDSGAGLTGGPITTTGTFAVGAGTNITVNADDVQVANAFNQSASGKSTTVGDFRGGIISITLTADTDNWAPANLDTAHTIAVTQSGAGWRITGLTGGTAGRMILIKNVSGNGLELLVKNNNSSSLAGNRFKLAGGADTHIYDGDAAWFYYDGTFWQHVQQEFVQELHVGTTGLTSAGPNGFSASTTTLGTITGTIAVNSSGSLTVGDFRGTRVTDSIVANQNDYAPTGYATATWFDLTPSGANRTITGLQGGQTGRRIIIRNVDGDGSSRELNIQGDDGSTSSATNRFLVSDRGSGTSTISLAARDATEFVYNGSRWVQLGWASPYNVFASNDITSNGTMSVVGTSTFGVISATTAAATFGDLRSTIVTATVTCSPASDCDNYAPTGHATATILDLTPSGASQTLTGLAGGAAGRRITIHNANAIGGFSIFLSSQNSSSTTTNRFITPDNITQVIYAKDSLNLFYNSAVSRWEVEKSKGFADIQAQTLSVNGVTGLGTTSTIGLLTASGGITANSTNTFNSTAGSSTFGDLRGAIIFDTISASQDNYTPPGAAPTEATTLVITPSGGEKEISGITGGASGRMLYIYNPYTSGQNLLLRSETTSTATNRFRTAANGVYTRLRPGTGAQFIYINSRWTEIEEMGNYTSNIDGTLTVDGLVQSNSGFSGGALTINGTATLNGATSTASTGNLTVGDFRGTVLAPTAITVASPTNDWAPSDIGKATVIIATCTGAGGCSLEGITTGALGRRLTIFNGSGGGQYIQIDDNAGGSTAANRFTIDGGYIQIQPGKSADFFYSNTSRWVLERQAQFYDLYTSSIAYLANTNVAGTATLGTIQCGGTSNITGTTTLGTGGGSPLTVTVAGPLVVSRGENKGTITLSTGTGTATVTSGAKCVCSDSTAVNAVQCAVSTTTLTATGTGSDVIVYHCF